MNELGDLRPSQLIYTFGVGSLVDLPNMSVLVMGLDDWDPRQCTEVSEERLLAALKKRLGPQLAKLYLPPIAFDDRSGQDSTATAHGVPVVPFPRWLRCPVCDTLASVESGVFSMVQDQWRPDRSRFVHAGCVKGNNPTALPVRFLVACRNGHLSDFPWVDYVHKGNKPCHPARLTLREYGAAGDASDIVAKCLECGSERRMGDAFDRESFKLACKGHHPHLRKIDQVVCQEESRPILLGASNSWFPSVMSVISIPRQADGLVVLIDELWVKLKDIPSLEVARYVTAPSRMPTLVEYTAEQIWEAIEAKKQGDKAQKIEDEDLKVPEWEVLNQKTPAPSSNNFQLRLVDAPVGFEEYFEKTVLLDRIREVRALMGFTRIESRGDFADAAPEEDDRDTPLCRQSPVWLPVSEVRGEGIFLRLKESMVHDWESRPAVRILAREFFEAHKAWRKLRRIKPVEGGFPGMRYLLLHSLSHAVMRQIALECGYTAASLRERLYSKSINDENGPAAGILIYTAASDSEGTLGGLVKLGEPLSMGRNLQQALEAMRICGSDPLCSEHLPTGEGRGIHGACCHACLFASETSCERGNRYLDRSVLVSTFAERGLEFFRGE